MNAREFAEWIAYSRLYPFGETIEDRRAGTIASAIVNVHKKKSAKAMQWEDFFPQNKAPERKGWQSLLEKVIALNAQLGGADHRKNNTPAE